MVTLTDFQYKLLGIEPEDEFEHVGFNRKILNNGEIWQFYECPACGNATAGKPEFCEKCYAISFEFVRIRQYAH